MYRWESLVSFLRKHDVIKIGLKQKGNVLRIVQSIHVVSWLLSSLFSCSESWVHPHSIKVSLPPLYLRRFSREKKYQALHACTTSILRSGAWEPGNEASVDEHWYEQNLTAQE